MQAYIKSMAETILQQLPPDMLPGIYYGIFSYLSLSIMVSFSKVLLKAKLTSSAVKRISFHFIHQIDADVALLEGLASAIPQIANEDHFAELRQLILLLLENNYEKYLEPVIRHKKYNKLKAQTIMAVMEK
jgi:hypothetical protein